MSKSIPTFEESMEELEKILSKMSSDEITLDESIKLYARAAELIAICNEKLNQSVVRVREIDDRIKELELDNDV